MLQTANASSVLDRQRKTRSMTGTMPSSKTSCESTHSIFGKSPIVMWVLVLFACLGFAGQESQAQSAYFAGALQGVTSSTSLQYPYGIVMDSQGDLFVAQTYNGLVEIQAVNGAITAASTIRQIVGSQLANVSALAIDASGNLYAGSFQTGLLKISAVSGVIPTQPTVTVIDSSMTSARNIAVAPNGNVYVATTSNVFEYVATSGTVSSSSAKLTLGSFTFADGIAVDVSGNLYVGDYDAGAVYEYSAVAGSVPTTATATTLSSNFLGPMGITLDASGNLYIVDQRTNQLDELLAVNGVMPASPVFKVVGVGVGGTNNANDVAVDGKGNAYVTNSYSNVGTYYPVTDVSSNVNFGSVNVGAAATPQTLSFAFNATTTGVSVAALTQGVTGLDYSDAGTGTCTTNGTTHSYAAGATCTVVLNFTPSYPGSRPGAVELVSAGAPIATALVTGTGSGPQIVYPGSNTYISTPYTTPTAIAVDGSQNLYVVDSTAQTLNKSVITCGTTSCITQLGGGFGAMFGVALDGAGNIYVADNSNNAIKEIPPTCKSATCVTTLGGGFSAPTGIALDAAGNIYVADYGNKAVKMMPQGCTSASCVTTLGGGFTQPVNNLSVDSNGNVYVAIFSSALVQEIPAGCTAAKYAASTCSVTTIGGGFLGPNDTAVDAAGTVYVADNSANAIKAIPPGCTSSSCVTTLLQASISNPNGLTLDNAGDIFIANTGLKAIRELSRGGQFGLYFNTTTKVETTDTADGALTQQLTNIGNQTLSLLAPTTGSNPSVSSSFALSSTSTCPSTTSAATSLLLAGATCNYAVNFVPAADGSITGSLVITDNNLKAYGSATTTSVTQSISLSGTGTGSPTISVSGGNNAPSGNPGVAYAGATFSASGGLAPYTYTATGLPAGLTMSTTGTISGTPTAEGQFTVQAIAKDADGFTGNNQFTLYIFPNITLAPTSLPGATYGHTYSTTVTATGGVAPYTYSVATGYSLPPGLTLSSAGVLSGTPTSQGSYNLVIVATDGGANQYQQGLPLTVATVPLTVTANPASMVYGNALPTLSGTLSGVLTGDGITASYSTTATATSPISATGVTYSVTATLNDPNGKLSNYTVTNTPATFTITKAPLSVVANAATMVYGGPLPTLSGTLTGAVSTDGITASYTTNATVTSASGGTYSVTATLNDPNSKLSNYTVTNTPAAFTITNGTLTITAANATKVYGTANPTFTGTVTGQANSEKFTETFTTTATATSPVTTYAIVPSVTGTTLADYTQAVTNGTLTITKATSATVLTAGSTSITPVQSVTLTAVVSDTSASSTGTPTNTVTFYDGTTALGTESLLNGTAAYTTSALAAGATHSFTAVYGGDTNFSASAASNAVSVVVAANDFTITSSGTTNQTVKAGTAASFSFQVSPVYTAYPAAVTLSVSGLPSGTTATFTPSTIASTAGAQTVTLSIQTTSSMAMLKTREELRNIAFALLLLPLMGMRKRKLGVRLACLLLFLAGMTFGLTGCASAPAPQTFNVVVTATSGTTTHTSAVTLVVD